MTTPIIDFVSRYAGEDVLRLHMPGHKGKSYLGFEERDITEIEGADSLYEANGIIKESEENASKVFGCKTYYSTEGSSQCIRTMVYLCTIYAKAKGQRPCISAFRNVHKTFLFAAAMTDCEVNWLYGEDETYLSCTVSEEALEKHLTKHEGEITAVYLTSPDYLGKIADIKALSEVCHRYGVLLIVDNAHGAYLKFLPESEHPIDLGADMCCDSAHKTLGVLTGGAYLHLSGTLPKTFELNAKKALALFGSTSPSYLILQSLDKANEYLSASFKSEIEKMVKRVDELKKAMVSHGYTLYGDEKMKITICTKAFGYFGKDFASQLRQRGGEVEFADPDYAVIMLSVAQINDMDTLEGMLLSIEKKPPIELLPPKSQRHEKAMSIRQAIFSECENVKAENSVHRVLSYGNIACPPAVPIVMCGEKITKEDISAFSYYDINSCSVVK